MKLRKVKLIFLGLVIFIIGCEEDNSSDGQLPTISTNDVISITSTSATSGGNITDDGDLSVTKRGVCWSTNQNPTINDNITNDGAGPGNFTSILSGLNVNTTYYLRSYATNSKGTEYGNEINFITLDGLPTGITTNDINEITATTATCGGKIIDDGGFEIESRGVCWSKNQSPTINENKTNDGIGLGSFVSYITGLEPNNTYYLRSYATNSIGTIYGNEISFTTENGLPIIETNEISEISATTAISGGEIIDDGGFIITACGVCWSTEQNPTTVDAHTIDGTGVGSFTSNLTGLIEWTTYYVRAYATNSNGTIYGNEVSFTLTGTQVTDYDGNVYGVVRIGDQIWMAENLKVTHYADGTEIPLITDNTVWANLGNNSTDDAYCYYNNDIDSEYGALYTWSAAMHGEASSGTNPSGIQGVCPNGWHIPSNSEWNELAYFIRDDGYSENAGTALRSTSGWNADGNGTDVYGFTALPGGRRNTDTGLFKEVGDQGYWWTSNDAGYMYGTYRNINLSSVPSYSTYKSVGFSIRCIAD